MSTERPILFSGPMVCAILDGRKTQTRRVIQNGKWMLPEDRFIAELQDEVKWALKRCCPYGAPGDRLWVRETWCCAMDDGTYRTTDDGLEYIYLYRATEKEHVIKDDGDGGTELRADGTEASPWQPSIFMPRAASRITLEITEVRVQRVQDITPDDCRAEGQPADNNDIGVRYGFGQLWDSLNAKRGFGWEKNPWVWAITFKRL